MVGGMFFSKNIVVVIGLFLDLNIEIKIGDLIWIFKFLAGDCFLDVVVFFACLVLVWFRDGSFIYGCYFVYSCAR